MGQPLRMYEPDRVYEITARTIQGRFLLRPGDEENDIIAGIIGRGLAMYPEIQLYGVVVLSNHITWLLSSSEPETIPLFTGYVNGNLSRKLGIFTTGRANFGRGPRDRSRSSTRKVYGSASNICFHRGAKKIWWNRLEIGQG